MSERTEANGDDRGTVKFDTKAPTTKRSAMSAKELDAVLDAVGVDSAFPMISVDEALQLVLEHTPHSLGTETVALDQALGAVAATDVVCLMDLPPYEASIVDGFAIAEKDGQDLEGHDLRLTAATIAGSGRSVVLERGAKEAVYVTTGAPVPRNTSRVVPIERCTKGEAPGVVRVASLKAEHGNCWIRAAGSDVPAGKVCGSSVWLSLLPLALCFVCG